MPTYIDGCAASEAWDSSGESIDIKNLDISSLEGAVLNWEHLSGTPAAYVGKIVKAKKIFSKDDCSNERELKFWNKCQIPFLYCLCILFDDHQPSAREVAGIFAFDDAHPELPRTLGFSIEGSKLEKLPSGVISYSIGRKLTLTAANANKTCDADTVKLDSTTDQASAAVSDPLSFLFKSVEIELFKSEEPLEKGISQMNAPNSTMPLSSPKPFGSQKAPKPAKEGLKQAPANEGASIGQTNSGQHVMSHAKVHNYPTFNAEDHRNAAILHSNSAEAANKAHNPKMAMHHNQKMQLHNQAAASLERRANRFPNAVKQHTTKLENKDLANVVKKSEEMDKALEAGSGLASPGQLNQGAALAKEDAEGHKFLSSQHPSQFKVGRKYGPKQMAYTGSTDTHHNFMHGDRAVKIKRAPMLKSEWLIRAEEAYEMWGKKEEFRNFMKERLPKLTKAEIDAMGRTLLLKKTLEAEKALGDLVKNKK